MTVVLPLSPFVAADPAALDPAKFRDPLTTARGEARATVPLTRLETLWFNTGTLCNIACLNCYIESSPRNDALTYLTAAEVEVFLDEVAALDLGVREIGLTGGEPFMNREIIAILEAALARDFRVLVLTNAMRPMRRFDEQLLALRQRYPHGLTLRVSLDHHTAAVHDAERGAGGFAATLEGLRWLAANGFDLAVAGRSLPQEADPEARAAYQRLFDVEGLPVAAADPARLVLFPEMDARVDVPEVTTACWGILGKSPADVMCATSRMVVKRKGADRPIVLSCTLVPYEPGFEMGATLAEAMGAVSLNHPNCAKFCVLGGASCSPG
ncbi:MAG: radical SAM protein [Caulobacteraceae bacterium]|nr:radical SAM protein [Caulobacteraceae bacterium]